MKERERGEASTRGQIAEEAPPRPPAKRRPPPRAPDPSHPRDPGRPLRALATAGDAGRRRRRLELPIAAAAAFEWLGEPGYYLSTRLNDFPRYECLTNSA